MGWREKNESLIVKTSKTKYIWYKNKWYQTKLWLLEVERRRRGWKTKSAITSKTKYIWYKNKWY